jgi:hypothetical protein
MGLETAVLTEARARGINLRVGSSLRWLTVRGHLDPIVQREAPTEIVEALDELHSSLGGNRRALARKQTGLIRPDLVVATTGQLIEVDEVEHFTNARLATLNGYSSKIPFGFSIDDYKELIDTWKAKANAVFTQRWSPDFDFVGGRRAQRAYYDALKDWLAPTFTGHPVLRLAVPDGDARSAASRLFGSLNY